jgi:hypothetical protein
MIRCKYAVCAETAIIDARSNHLSLVNILDDVTVPALPGILASITTVFVLERDSEDTERFDAFMVVSQSGKETQRFPVTVDFAGVLRNRTVLQLAGFPITAPGMLRFELVTAVAGEVLGAWEMPISTGGPRVIEATK